MCARDEKKDGEIWNEMEGICIFQRWSWQQAVVCWTTIFGALAWLQTNNVYVPPPPICSISCKGNHWFGRYTLQNCSQQSRSACSDVRNVIIVVPGSEIGLRLMGSQVWVAVIFCWPQRGLGQFDLNCWFWFKQWKWVGIIEQCIIVDIWYSTNWGKILRKVFPSAIRFPKVDKKNLIKGD